VDSGESANAYGADANVLADAGGEAALTLSTGGDSHRLWTTRPPGPDTRRAATYVLAPIAQTEIPRCPQQLIAPLPS
jgi:hypothetical protein